MPEFQKGDRIVFEAKIPPWHGETGVVVEVYATYITVDFDREIKDTRRWICLPHQLKLLEAADVAQNTQDMEPGYHITVDGFKTNPENWEPGKWLI